MYRCLDAIGITTGTTGLLLGQAAAAADLSAVGTVLQGGAFAVLAYAFLHLIVKTLPAKDTEHATAMAALTDRQTAVVDKLATRQTESLDRLADAINNLRVHCAAVQRVEPNDRRTDPVPRA